MNEPRRFGARGYGTPRLCYMKYARPPLGCPKAPPKGFGPVVCLVASAGNRGDVIVRDQSFGPQPMRPPQGSAPCRGSIRARSGYFLADKGKALGPVGKPVYARGSFRVIRQPR